MQNKKRLIMNIYLAPLEGITNNVFRTNQNKYFGGIDKYFTPFITPSEKGALGAKIKRDILPENNKNQILIPQILTNSSQGFITMCKRLEQYGYTEFNLNLGCPSGTVTSKGRGSGFLAYPDMLNYFLEEIFKSNYKISIKTRIGIENPEEFYKLLKIYNCYPLTELIIHPRTKKDMYKNTPNWEIYKYATENTCHKLCYNGDIFTKEDYDKFIKAFPDTENIMLGRGVIKNPALPLIINGAKDIDISLLRDFYYNIYEDYRKILSGDTPVMYKMKEILFYMAELFQDNQKIIKKIKKAKTTVELNNAVDELFFNHTLQ